MVGLGCGARSYTSALHYSSEYAVGARGVREILEAYVQRSEASFDAIDYGFELSPSERRRRFMILSILSDEGLDLEAYRARFGSDAIRDFEELDELERLGLAARHEGEGKGEGEGEREAEGAGP